MKRRECEYFLEKLGVVVEPGRGVVLGQEFVTYCIEQGEVLAQPIGKLVGRVRDSGG